MIRFARRGSHSYKGTPGGTGGKKARWKRIARQAHLSFRPVGPSITAVASSDTLFGFDQTVHARKIETSVHGCVRLQRWGSFCRACPSARTFIPDGALWEMNVVERRLVDHAAGGVRECRGKNSFSDKVSGKEEQLVGRNGRDASSAWGRGREFFFSASLVLGTEIAGRADGHLPKEESRPSILQQGGHDLQHRLEKHK